METTSTVLFLPSSADKVRIVAHIFSHSLIYGT